MNKYEVGQVLFVIDSEKNAVLPCRVIEEVTKKTLEGDQVFYKVIFGTSPKNVRDLAEVKGEIFTSLVDVRTTLLNNVTAWVESHVQKAAKSTMEWYKYDALATENVRNEVSQENQISTIDVENPMVGTAMQSMQTDPMMIEIAPGQFAKVRSVKSALGS